MNHSLAYARLIANAKVRGVVNGYSEVHHILPRAFGGTNDSSNLVSLTAREHFIAHVLLAHMHGGPMWFAIVRMKGGQLSIYNNARLYEAARKKCSVYMSERLKGNTHTLGFKHSEKTRAQMSIDRAGKAGRPQSDETKRKLSLANIGNVPSSESLKKISAKLKGVPKSESHRLNISIGLTGKPKSEIVRQKLSEANKGKFLAKETKAKISLSLFNNQRTLGYRHTDESKEKMSLLRKGKKLSAESLAKRRATIAARNFANKAIEVARFKNHVVGDFATSFEQSEKHSSINLNKELS